MFKFLLGCIVGLFSAMIGFSFLAAFNSKIDLSVFTNIIIAAATVVATLIHFDFRRAQKRERIWELNKDILLGLAESLSAVIGDLERATNHYFYADQGIEEVSVGYEYPEDLHQEFTYKTFAILNAYRPLMNKDFLGAIEQFKASGQRIDDSVNQGELSVFQAYDLLLDEHKKLQKHLSRFIEEVSGVRYT